LKPNKATKNREGKIVEMANFNSSSICHELNNRNIDSMTKQTAKQTWPSKHYNEIPASKVYAFVVQCTPENY
jgi:hypothetical protein